MGHTRQGRLGRIWLRIRSFEWTKRRRISGWLALAWVVWLAVTLAIPTGWYGHYIFNTRTLVSGTFTEHLEPKPLNYRPVSYHASISLTTDGIYSAYKEIHVNVRIYNVNISGLTNDYHGVAFTNMSTTRELTLIPLSNGTYTAEGDITFYTEEQTWIFLVPKSPTGYVNLNTVLYPNELKQIESQSPVLRIGPQSDTLAYEFNAFAVKTGFVFGSFSLLLLQSVIMDILIRQQGDE